MVLGPWIVPVTGGGVTEMVSVAVVWFCVGSVTNTGMLWTVVKLAAGTTAVSVVAFTNVVVTGEPSIVTTELDTKPVPVRVMVVGDAPSRAVFGDTEVSTTGMTVSETVVVAVV